MFRFLKLATLFCCGVLFITIPASSAEVYQWKDGAGIVHFTDDLSRVPPPYREKVRELSLPEAQTTAPEPQLEQPPAPEQEEEAETLPQAVDPYTECMQQLQKEKDRLSEQLASDQARLKEVNAAVHQTTRARIENELERERADLRARISAAERAQQEVIPQKEWECQRKRVELPAPVP